MSDYECHITLHRADGQRAAELISTAYRGDNDTWKTSEIARDPVLGDATYFYLTAYDDNLLTMHQRMHALAKMLTANGIQVVRLKIELIVYDLRCALIKK